MIAAVNSVTLVTGMAVVLVFTTGAKFKLLVLKFPACSGD